MRLLFVADPLEQFNIKKDSTFAMMKEAAARGHEILACEPRHLVWQRGGRVGATMRQVALSGDPVYWFTEQHVPETALADVDAVLMRKDPPFDSEYFYATHLLQQAEREGAHVFNKPAALRDHPEKLAILEFPQLIGPTLVTRDAEAIRRFHAEHRDIILKPLDGMGGMGIFRVGADGLNLGSITETLNRHGTTTVMVQRYLPEIDAEVHVFYSRTLAGFWPAGRAWVEEGYRTLDFPFEEIALPPFEIVRPLTLAELAGFLGTWSATERYKTAHGGEDPVLPVIARIAVLWGSPDTPRPARWPLAVRAGYRRG